MRIDNARKAVKLDSTFAIGFVSVQRLKSKFLNVPPWRSRMLFIKAVWKLRSVMYSKTWESGIKTETLYGLVEESVSEVAESSRFL